MLTVTSRRPNSKSSTGTETKVDCSTSERWLSWVTRLLMRTSSCNSRSLKFALKSTKGPRSSTSMLLTTYPRIKLLGYTNSSLTLKSSIALALRWRKPSLLRGDTTLKPRWQVSLSTMTLGSTTRSLRSRQARWSEQERFTSELSSTCLQRMKRSSGNAISTCG